MDISEYLTFIYKNGIDIIFVKTNNENSVPNEVSELLEKLEFYGYKIIKMNENNFGPKKAEYLLSEIKNNGTIGVVFYTTELNKIKSSLHSAQKKIEEEMKYNSIHFNYSF